ncbi:DNA REPAIR RAD52-LIKE PROTEIN 2 CHLOROPLASTIC [Salix purpurea]|uniref:DNA REPAIR RAD52-LIKE PROTEIN 2 CHLOROPLASTIC n=1 Tax=Salix purpurea TaxID=77065 RepID=A0A9Q0QEP0_SALPP|nr:DNA repair RAD52 protein [Salix suchowensis]KAJ6705235.1 DNA REPAIR RAD52-LIKE PROTEIN 2 CHLOROPLASTIC [Salix purpurea]
MSVHNSSSVVILTKSPSRAALLSPTCRLNMIDSRNNHFRTRDCKLTMHSIVAGSNGNGTGGSVPAGGGGGGDGGVKKKGVPNSNYVVPLDKSLASAYTSCITRPLSEILRDLNKRIPDNIIKPPNSPSTLIPWYHANRMLSFYAPGWCGEIRDVIFAENGSVTVVYRVTIRGSDGEAHRESSGTVTSSDVDIEDPVAAAEEIAFCRACARFGLGLYLYHEE